MNSCISKNLPLGTFESILWTCSLLIWSRILVFAPAGVTAFTAIGLTKSLGKELADKNIAVNAVTPAGAKTRILDQMSKEHVQRMLSKVPRGRFLEIHEFTSLICWLSSEENTFSTAAVFDISGGRSTY